MNFQLDINTVSQPNKMVLREIKETYHPVDTEKLLNWAKKIDINSILVDLVVFQNQIKADLSRLGTEINPAVIGSLNRGLLAEDYSLVRDAIKGGIDINNQQVINIVLPKLMELNNIYKIARQLNAMPGASGKPNNSLKLPEFKL